MSPELPQYIISDLPEEMGPITQWMDFSNKSPQDPLYNADGKGVTGLMKDECGSNILTEVALLRSKCYCLSVLSFLRAYGLDTNLETCAEYELKCKGAPIPKDFVKRCDVIRNYFKCLGDNTVESITFSRIASHNQTVQRETATRNCISAYCDKRHYAVCGNHTVSHREGLPRDIPCPDPIECLFTQAMWNWLHGTPKL